MATNDTIRKLGTPVTLEANGAGISSTAFGVANDADLTTANVAGYDLAIFELYIAGMSAAPSAGSWVALYERKYMTGGTNQAPAPSATYKQDLLGIFPVAAIGTAQYLRLEGVPINFHGATYYVEWFDNGTSQTIDAGWTLTATPYTHAPAA